MTKVGDINKNEAEAEEKPKGRQPYDLEALVAENAKAVDSDGMLTIVPEDYDSRKHIPLKKEDFTNEATFIRYQSLVAGQRAEFYAQRSSELAGKADRLEKFGSESARKTASKLARAKQSMAKLRTQLLESGMSEEELDALISDM